MHTGRVDRREISLSSDFSVFEQFSSLQRQAAAVSVLLGFRLGLGRGAAPIDVTSSRYVDRARKPRALEFRRIISFKLRQELLKSRIAAQALVVWITFHPITLSAPVFEDPLE